MSYELSSVEHDGRQLCLSSESWGHVLDMATLGGWEPAGTCRPPWWDDPPDDIMPVSDSWDGEYFNNDGQVVGADDARVLADAVGRMLPDVPDECVIEHKLAVAVLPNGLVHAGLRPDARANCFEWWGGRKALLRQLVELCRAGAFAIW